MADIYDSVATEEADAKDSTPDDLSWTWWFFSKAARFMVCGRVLGRERVQRVTEHTFDQNIDELTEQITRLRNKIDHELSYHRIEKQRLEDEVQKETSEVQREKLTIQVLHEEDIMAMYHDDDKQLILLKNAVDKRVAAQKSSAGMLNVLDLEEKVAATSTIIPYSRVLTRERQQQDLDKIAESMAESQAVLKNVAARIAGLQQAEVSGTEETRSYAHALITEEQEARIKSRMADRALSAPRPFLLPAAPSQGLPAAGTATLRRKYAPERDGAVLLQSP